MSFSKTLMRREFVMGLTLLGCGQTQYTPDVSQTSTYQEQDNSYQATPIINALRARYNLSPVTASHACAYAALMQSRNMARTGVFYHIINGIGDEGQFKPRMKMSGVALPAAENIAFGQRSLERVMEVWTLSPGHLKNMINPKYTQFAVARAQHANTQNKIYWTMVLGA